MRLTPICLNSRVTLLLFSRFMSPYVSTLVAIPKVISSSRCGQALETSSAETVLIEECGVRSSISADFAFMRLSASLILVECGSV